MVSLSVGMRTDVLALTSVKPWMLIAPLVTFSVAVTVCSCAIALAPSRRILDASPVGWLPVHATRAMTARATDRLNRVPGR